MTKKALAEPAKFITFEDVAEQSETEAGEPYLIDALVEAELQKHGSLGTAPCSEAMDLLRQWSYGDDEIEKDYIQQWHGYAARRNANPPAIVVSSSAPALSPSGSNLNDAVSSLV